ncbi:MAG: tRNA pseudouridine(13) synthase TruD [Archangium gephyra]|uniref:tRNA pseudouridine(13) synthase TruD n=1 Tax=Archangium gephyra TaxID=48 RepID=A0A2W5T2Z6_9BACT|nr:MAG: tRNA pseudouridine(13) synthase TruD [Archangium gephyra]
MKIKQKPEDFSVKESFRFDEVENGPYRVYLMDKQKLSTFDAVARIQQRFGLPPGSVSYCGLKDKQGRTEQLVAVKGVDIDIQEEDLRLKFMGRTDKALSSKNTTSNRFAVTVREIEHRELQEVTLAATEVERLGVVNYFDSQRFGALKHGQGFIAKDLIKGDFEAALHNYLAVPSPLDLTDDAKVKQFWSDNWGDWTAKVPFQAGRKYQRIIHALRDEPENFLNAFLQIDADYRAMLIFEYQSYLWNEGVRRLLQLTFPREHLFPMPYQAGTLLHHTEVSPEMAAWLRDRTFPLLAPNSSFKDPKIEEAVKWVLGKEKLTLEQMRIEEAPKLLYFKHEERPLLVHPGKLVVGKPRPDELNRGFLKVNIAFTLPPGSYATLVVKRLFHFGVKKETQEDVAPRKREDLPQVSRSKVDHKSGEARPSRRQQVQAEPAATAESQQRGFRAQQKEKKQLKAQRRMENTKR